MPNNLGDRKWYVYLLECCDGSYYTGVTTNIEKRMRAHQAGIGSKYVASKGFKMILVSREGGSKSEVYKTEYMIKQLPKKNKLEWFFK